MQRVGPEGPRAIETRDFGPVSFCDFGPEIAHLPDRQRLAAGRRADQPSVIADTVAQHCGNDYPQARAFICGARRVDCLEGERRLPKMVDDGGDTLLKHLRRADSHGQLDLFRRKVVQASPYGIEPAVELKSVAKPGSEIFRRVRMSIRQAR